MFTPLDLEMGGGAMIGRWEGPVSQFRHPITMKVRFLEKSNLGVAFPQVSQKLRALFQCIKTSH